MRTESPKNKGKIFIVSGPSGVGKDTIIKEILKKFPELVMVKSYTTRPKRKSNEVGNRYFVSEEEFKKLIDRGELIEWAKVHKYYYGRKKNDIVRHIKKGVNVIIEVDVIGAMAYKKKFPNSVLIFVKYEDPNKFIQRIKKNRPEITQEELKTRRKSMNKEMEYEKYYDYSVVNPEGYPERAIKKVEKIIRSAIMNPNPPKSSIPDI